ncbi:hypothetical protein [Longibaculum muris]|uniref:hypothetical protein n=1 Tax=Longibaculum muris TaxID=1796628 RepID=UPI0022E983F4|nr:hypothetical protein [Longibaculum muris]
MSNDDIDKLLTTKILANGFKPVSLTIGTMTDATFKTEETKSSSQTKEATKNKVSVIKQVNVIASISGNFSNLNKLLDAINNQKGLEIGNLTYQVSSNEKNTISISFIVYMVQK